MNRVEEIAHIQLIFRRSDAERIMSIVNAMRDIAIGHLDAIKADVPRAISDQVMKEYQDMGVSLEWDLTNCDSVYEFSVMSRDVDMTPLQIRAVELLRASSDVIRVGILTEQGRDWLLSTYALLDSPAIEKAKKFPAGRQKGSMSESTIYIQELARLHPEVQAKVLFDMADKQRLTPGMVLKTFENHLSKVKQKEKKKSTAP